MWAAYLTEIGAKRENLSSSPAAFLKQLPDRASFSDWYETEDGSYHCFRARGMQDGCFIPLSGDNA